MSVERFKDQRSLFQDTRLAKGDSWDKESLQSAGILSLFDFRMVLQVRMNIF